MKERYNSENQLKEAFEKFQMPIDNEAFEKFQQSLDNDKRKKRIIWWRRLGMILLPIIILFIAVPFFTLKKYEETIEVVSSIPQTHKPKPSAITSHITNNSTVSVPLDSTNQRKTKIKTNFDQKHFDLVESSHTPTKTVNADENLNIKYTSDNYLLSNELASSTNGNQRTVMDRKTESSEISVIPSSTQLQSKTAEEANRNTFTLITPLPSLHSGITYKRTDEQIDLSILPHKEPFKKYFYLSLSSGMVINDNYGPSNNNFSVLDSKKLSLSGALAYQFSENSAVELSYSQFIHSTGYSSKIDPTYSNEQGFLVRVIKGSLVNKLWSPFQGFQIDMTNGIAAMVGKDERFDTSSYSNLSPEIVKSAEIVSHFTDPKIHLMYSGGLQANFLLSENLDYYFAANYTLGFKQRSYSRLRYLEGEGIYNTTESLSDGNFFAFSLGFKYRFQ